MKSSANFAEFVYETKQLMAEKPEMLRLAAAVLCVVGARAPNTIAKDPDKLLAWLDKILSTR